LQGKAFFEKALFFAKEKKRPAEALFYFSKKSGFQKSLYRKAGIAS